MFIKEEKREWTKGIPEYKEEDIMTRESLYDFALDIIYDYAKEQGYNVLDCNKDMQGMPSMVMKKDNQLYFVLIDANVAPRVSTISPLRKNNMLLHANKFNAISFYASCSFGSVDKERFDASLALKGDEYYCRFTGFEELRVEFTDIHSLDYHYNLLGLIGESYEKYDYDMFSEFIDPECDLSNELTNAHYNNKFDIDEYFYRELRKLEDSKIRFVLCKAIDNLDNNKSEPKLLLNIEDEKEKTSYLIDIKINEKGLIGEFKIQNIAMKGIMFN